MTQSPNGSPAPGSGGQRSAPPPAQSSPPPVPPASGPNGAPPAASPAGTPQAAASPGGPPGAPAVPAPPASAPPGAGPGAVPGVSPGAVTLAASAQVPVPVPDPRSPAGAPAVPAPPAAATPPAAAGPPGLPRRRTAFMEGLDRVRAAAVTEPGRLRIIGAVLAALVVAFGAVTAWQMAERAAAAEAVVGRSQPLSSAAADIYRSLADANTAASSGFLAGGQETDATRKRYERDIERASEGLVRAAANSAPDSPAGRRVRELNRLLPEYKGHVERARANNRLGYPVGGAWLRHANELMQDKMLPAAEALYTSENRRLDADYAEARPYPWAAIALGLAALGALGWAQHRTYRRTNRVLNQGLVAATAATGVVLLWLVVGHSVARAHLNASYDKGVRSLNVLHDARIASVKARGNENLTLVARGAETVTVKDDDGEEVVRDAFDHRFEQNLKELNARLSAAARLSDDQAGLKPVADAREAMKAWRTRHAEAREHDDDGEFTEALVRVIGRPDKDGGTSDTGTTGECFDNVDASLARALAHERAEFEREANDGRDAMAGLPAGAAALGVLGAAGAVLGIGRRLSEYR